MSKIEITCRCGKRYAVITVDREGQFRCEHCGHTNRVPASDQGVVDATLIAEATQPDNTAATVKQRQRRAVKELIRGPEMPEYQRRSGGSARRRMTWIVAIVGVLGVMMSLVELYATIQTGNPNWGHSFITSLVFAVGYLLFSAALLEWKWFFHLKKLRRLRKWLGDRFARIQYMTVGVAVMMLGVSFAYDSESKSRHRRRVRAANQQAAQQRAARPRIWNVTPGRVADARPGLLIKPLPLAPGVDLDAKFSSPGAGQAAILFDDPGGPPVLCRYDLRNNELLTRTSLDQNSAILDFRPDAGATVISTVEREPPSIVTTITVLRCGAEVDQQFAAIQFRERRAAKDAALVGQNELLVSKDSWISMYRLPDGKRVYTHRDHPFPKLWLSNNRQYVLTSKDRQLVLIDSKDGTIRGELEQPTDFGYSIGSVSAAAFHPSGESVAVAASRRCYIWSLIDGSLLNEFRIRRTSTLRWTSPVHLLADKNLIDTEMKARVWTYRGRLLPDSADGRIYFTTGNEGVQPVHLDAIKAPSDKLAEQFKRISTLADDWPEKILGFGSSTLDEAGESIEVLNRYQRK